MNFDMMDSWGGTMGSNFWFNSFGFFWWLAGIEVVVIGFLIILWLWKKINKK